MGTQVLAADATTEKWAGQEGTFVQRFFEAEKSDRGTTKLSCHGCVKEGNRSVYHATGGLAALER